MALWGPPPAGSDTSRGGTVAAGQWRCGARRHLEATRRAAIGACGSRVRFMPTPQPTPSGVVQFRMHFEPGSDEAVYAKFAMGYTCGPPSTSDLSDLAASVTAQFAANLKSLLTEAGALYDVEAIDLANPDTPAGLHAVAVDGTRAGTQVPNNVTALLNKTVDRRYRGSKPKNFLPFGTDGDIESTNQWSSTFSAAVTAGWAAFTTALLDAEAGSTVLTVEKAVSYFSGSEPNPNPNSRLRKQPTPRATPLVQTVVSATCSPIFGSQRKRLRP